MTSIGKAITAFKARFASPPVAAAVPEPAQRPSSEIVLCIPGDWADRSDFLRRIITLEPTGRYMFAGMLLVDLQAKEHVQVDIAPADPALPRAFQIAAQGKRDEAVLQGLAHHSSVAFLHFPADLVSQRERIVKFSNVVKLAGGIAVKVESSGVAHGWERWESLLAGSLFDQYVALATLVGGADFYYSCGMHSFGLPDCEVDTTLDIEEAADLINRFNFWRLSEAPVFSDGHTFSLAEDTPRYRLHQMADCRHEPDGLFFNPQGLWRLTAV